MRTTTLLLAAVCALSGGALDAQTTIEDRTKHVALEAPDDWLLSPDSGPALLVFVGPRRSGVESTLRVFQMPGHATLDDGGLDAALAVLGVEEHGDVAPWDVGSADQLFTSALSVEHELGRRDARTGLAAFAHGPGLLVCAYTIGDARWDREQDELLGSLQSVAPSLWQPVHVDEQMGLAFYDVPAEAELVADRTTPGSAITWHVLTGDGQLRAEILVRTQTPAADFAAWLDEREAAYPTSGRVVSIERVDTVMNGRPAARFEVHVDYGGYGNVIVETCVQTDGALISVQGQCLDSEYDEVFAGPFARLHGGLALTAAASGGD